MTADDRRHRVLLVREWDQQTTGASCCGRLQGGEDELTGAADFARTREGMEAMGAVYRALAAELPRDVVDIQVVDPRNVTFLIPGILHDARTHGASWREAVRALAGGVGQGAIVVDGRVVSRGDVPQPDEAVSMVMRSLAAA